MNIVHYLIGMPYKRKGGMMAYVESLIEAQSSDKRFQNISVMFPFAFSLNTKNSKIMNQKKINKINYVPILNPVNETLGEGILNPHDALINNSLSLAITKWVVENKITIIHFHTFFGLSTDVFDQLKTLKVRMIFSAHDFQPICPIITLYDGKGVCRDSASGTHCCTCNSNALSHKEIFFRNNIVASKLQEFQPIKSFLKLVFHYIRNTFNSQSINVSTIVNYESDLSGLFFERNNRFASILSDNIDLVVYNSFLTLEAFHQHGVKNSHEIVLPVSHSKINFNFSPFNFHFKSALIRFGFLGGLRNNKGIEVVMDLFIQMKHIGIDNFEVHMYGEHISHYEGERPSNFIFHNYEKNKGLIFSSFDILLVPTISIEPFGFIISEALSNNKGVICSDNVGAKDFFSDGLFVYRTKEELFQYVKSGLEKNEFKFNERIESFTFGFNDHYSNLCNLVYNI